MIGDLVHVYAVYFAVCTLAFAAWFFLIIRRSDP